MKQDLKDPLFEIDIRPLGSVGDVSAAMAAIMHDCPDCRAAKARGETPQVITGDALMASLSRQDRRRIERAQARAARRAARRGGPQ